MQSGSEAGKEDAALNWNIAVVEDDAAAAQLLQDYFARYGESTGDAFHVTVFPSGEKFLFHYKPVYDALFLDVGLPGMNGMETAERFRELSADTVLVFVTNMAQYAIRGYEVAAFDFLLKPVTYSFFAMKLQRVVKKLASQKSSELIISLADGKRRISSSQIRYVEISSHTMIYHTAEGTFVSYGTLKELEEKLNPERFVRCNNCYLVNLDCVVGLNSHSVTLNDQTELAVSRQKKKQFVQALNAYCGGMV